MKQPHVHKRIIMLEPYEYGPAEDFFKKTFRAKNVDVRLENVSDYSAFQVTETSPSKVLVVYYELAKYDRKRITKFAQKVDNTWDLFLLTLDPTLKDYYNYYEIDYPINKQKVLDLLPSSTI